MFKWWLPRIYFYFSESKTIKILKPIAIPVDGVNQDVFALSIGDTLGDVRFEAESSRIALIGVELHFSSAFRPRLGLWLVGVLSIICSIFHHWKVWQKLVKYICHNFLFLNLVTFFWNILHYFVYLLRAKHRRILLKWPY